MSEKVRLDIIRAAQALAFAHWKHGIGEDETIAKVISAFPNPQLRRCEMGEIDKLDADRTETEFSGGPVVRVVGRLSVPSAEAVDRPESSEAGETSTGVSESQK